MSARGYTGRGPDRASFYLPGRVQASRTAANAGWCYTRKHAALPATSAAIRRRSSTTRRLRRKMKTSNLRPLELPPAFFRIPPFPNQHSPAATPNQIADLRDRRGRRGTLPLTWKCAGSPHRPARADAARSLRASSHSRSSKTQPYTATDLVRLFQDATDNPRPSTGSRSPRRNPEKYKGTADRATRLA